MGDVWKGVHREQDIPVAVKALAGETAHDPEFREEFEREVQAVAGLAHPGIVSVYDYGVIPESAARESDGRLVAGSPMLAMELADAGSLTNLNLIPDWPSLCDLLLQLLDALGYAHARGVIHRDVKPTNILLSSTATGRIRYKLTDFGIAHALDPYSSATTQEHGIYRGSPDYSPPEQLEGTWRDFGPWTDLYALGCVAYEFACGKPPFSGENFVKLAISHMDDPPPALEPRFELPEGFEAWVMRLLEKRPADRFGRAADAAWALLQLDAGPQLTPQPQTLGEPTVPTAPPERGSESVHLTPSTLQLRRENDSGEQDTVREREAFEQMPTIEVTQEFDRGAPNELTDELIGDDRRADGPSPSHSSPSHSSPTHLANLSLPEKAWQDAGSTGRETTPAYAPPPLPPSWRRERPRKPDAHLIGAGLNLFGLREVEFIGREAERDAIWERLHEVRDARCARAVVIRGPSGTGKSRLAQWMCQRAHEVGAAHVLTANHTPQSQPSEPLRRMFEQPLSTWGLAPKEVHSRVCEKVDRLFALGASQEDAYLLDYTARGVTEFLRPGLTAGDELDGPPVDFGSKRERSAVLSRFLQALSHDRPLVVWLDDVPWASEALDLVEYVLEERGDLPVLFVMTARDKCLSKRPALADRLDALAKASAVTDIELGPLPSPNHAELIEHLLTLSPDLAWQVEERTAGNPLFAVQLVRDWVERDVLEPSAQGFTLRDGADAPLPDDLSALCQERVDRFLAKHYPERVDEVRQLLEVGAALGREIDDVEWRTACKNLGLELPDDLVGQMVTHQLARRDHKGWAFVHGALREVIERGAKSAERWGYHQQNCILMLDELYGLETPGVWKRWGDHLYSAGELDEALEPYLAAANRARQSDDCPTGIQILDRVDAICEELGLEADVRQVRAWLQRAYLVRHYRQAHDQRASNPGKPNKKGARELIERAMELARERGWLRELGLALLEEARSYAHHGRFEEALGSYESARSIFEENGMGEEAVTTLLSMSAAQRHIGHFNQMRQSLKRARSLCQPHDERHRAQVHARYTEYYLDGPQQDLEQARVHAQRFLEAAQDHLSPLNQARAWSNLGEIKRLEAKYDAALDDYRKAYALASGVGAVNLPCVCLHNIGIAEFERGQIEAAKRWFRDSRICMEKNGYTLWVAVPILGVAACEAKQGNWEAAASLFEAAQTHLEGRKSFVRDLAVVCETLGEAAMQADRPALARRALELACEHWNVKEPGRVEGCEALLSAL